MNEVEEIKNRLNVADVIADYIQLTPAGANFKARCPFHSEKTPSFYVSSEKQFWHCFGCFLPKSLIKTEYGFHFIEDIQVGDKVLTHTARYLPVFRTLWRPYKGEIVDIKVRKSNEVTSLTSDHRVYMIKTKHCKNKGRSTRICQWNCQKSCSAKFYQNYKIEKVPASELSLNDYLLYPVNQKVKDIRFINLDKFYNRHRSNFGPSIGEIPTKIKVDDKFLKLLGYYIAEGSNHRAYIRFSLGNHELEFAKEIKNLIKGVFGIKAVIHKRKKGERTGLEISACNSKLSNIFENLCGLHAENKHIPFEFQYLPLEKQKILLDAIYKGDGHPRKIFSKSKLHHYLGERKIIGTISLTLAEQLRDILLRLKIPPSFYISPEKVDKERVHHEESYTIVWQEKYYLDYSHFYEKNGMLYWISPIREIKKRLYTGNVYNLTVTNDHSYTASNFVVGNCGEGGDIFTFVQKMEGIEFREALKILADKAGVKLEARDPNLETERNRLVSLCEWAALFFHQALLRSREGKIARDYLVSRKIGGKMIQKFLLGYSPFSWHLTMDFLRKKGFSAAEIFAAGLASQKTPGRFYDRFRGRLIFPLRNVHGQVVGFGARVLNEEKDHLGKYINSPQSLIYDKSGLLYALDQAKQMIKKENLCIAVEGYLDVISSHQAGVTNVVGVSGTALTPGQLTLMKRYTHNLALCFDADLAGVRAAKRGIENAIAAGLAVRVIILPKDEDPDSLIRKNPELWREATKRAVGIMEFYFDLALKHYNPEELTGKKMIAAEVLPTIKKIPDQIEQAYYLQKLSSLINIREESLREAMARIDLTFQYSQNPDRNVVAPSADFSPAPADIVGRRLLGLGLKYPRFLGEILEEAKPSILSPEWQDIYKVLSEYYNKSRSFDFIHFKRKIQTSHPQYVTRLEVAILDVEKDLEEDDQKEDIIALEVQQALKRLKEQYYRQKLEAIELQMQRAENIKDRVLSQSLTKQLQSFTQKLGKL